MTTPTIRLTIKPAPIIRGTVRGVGIPGPPGASGASDWSAISNKPLVFPPSAHGHTLSDISGFGAGVAAALALPSSGTGGLARISSPQFDGYLSLQDEDASEYATVRMSAGDMQISSPTYGLRNVAYRESLKTINGNSIYGGGNLSIPGYTLPSMTGQTGKFLTNNGTVESWGNTLNSLVVSGTVTTNNIATSTGDLITNIASGADAVFQSNGSETFRIKSGTQGTYHTRPIVTVGGHKIQSNATDFDIVLPNVTDEYFNVKRGATTCMRLEFNGRLSLNNALRATAIGFSTSPTSAGDDLTLNRDAADTLGQRRGTNAQTSSLYGTYQDASNYRRLRLSSTTAGAFSITAEGLGTGASGNTLTIGAGTGVLFSDGRASVTSDGSTITAASTFQIVNSGVKAKINQFNGVQLVAGVMFGWVASTADIGGSTSQTALAQNAAGVVEINNGTAGTYRDLMLRNITASGTIGFSQSRFQQPSAQVLQTQCFDTSLAAWQETTRSQASPTGAKWSVFGATPIIQQTLPAAATDAATTQTLCNAIRSLLVNFGFSN